MFALTCAWPVILAYACLVQVVAAAVYLALSLNSGTPFKDAVAKYPHLVAIQSRSREKRRNLFLLGLAVAVAVAAAWRPFPICPADGAGGAAGRPVARPVSASEDYGPAVEAFDGRRRGRVLFVAD